MLRYYLKFLAELMSPRCHIHKAMGEGATEVAENPPETKVSKVNAGLREESRSRRAMRFSWLVRQREAPEEAQTQEWCDTQ